MGRDINHPGAAGGDIQAWEWARYVVSQGHSVTYICSSYHGLKGEEEIAGVRVLRLGTGGLLPWHAFRFYRRHRHEFDAVYEDAIGGSRLPYLARLYVSQPIIAAWHQVNRELFYDLFPKPLAFTMSLAEKMLAKLYRDVDIRAPSEQCRMALHKELGLPLEHIHVIPASIPGEWVMEPFPRLKRNPLILCLGIMRPYKGFHMALQALPRVLSQCKDAHLVIAGRRFDPGYEQALRKLAADLGVTQQTEFKLDITEEEKKELIKRSKVLVLPSRLEGFGIVVLEANAYGVPVVASSGVPEDAVQQGYNGLRYPFEDVSALADSIIQILTDDEVYARLSANGLAFARQFAWRKVGAQYEELLKLVINNRR